MGKQTYKKNFQCVPHAGQARFLFLRPSVKMSMKKCARRLFSEGDKESRSERMYLWIFPDNLITLVRFDEALLFYKSVNDGHLWLQRGKHWSHGYPISSRSYPAHAITQQLGTEVFHGGEVLPECTTSSIERQSDDIFLFKHADRSDSYRLSFVGRRILFRSLYRIC